MISSERGKLLEGGGRLLEGFGKLSPHCPCDKRPAKNLTCIIEWHPTGRVAFAKKRRFDIMDCLEVSQSMMVRLPVLGTGWRGWQKWRKEELNRMDRMKRKNEMNPGRLHILKLP